MPSCTECGNHISHRFAFVLEADRCHECRAGTWALQPGAIGDASHTYRTTPP